MLCGGLLAHEQLHDKVAEKHPRELPEQLEDLRPRPPREGGRLQQRLGRHRLPRPVDGPGVVVHALEDALHDPLLAAVVGARHREHLLLQRLQLRVARVRREPLPAVPQRPVEVPQLRVGVGDAQKRLQVNPVVLQRVVAVLDAPLVVPLLHQRERHVQAELDVVLDEVVPLLLEVLLRGDVPLELRLPAEDELQRPQPLEPHVDGPVQVALPEQLDAPDLGGDVLVRRAAHPLLNVDFLDDHHGTASRPDRPVLVLHLLPLRRLLRRGLRLRLRGERPVVDQAEHLEEPERRQDPEHVVRPVGEEAQEAHEGGEEEEVVRQAELESQPEAAEDGGDAEPVGDGDHHGPPGERANVDGHSSLRKHNVSHDPRDLRGCHRRFPPAPPGRVCAGRHAALRLTAHSSAPSE
ncbi:zinc ABC transporter substrate-binding protein [Babesia caballi]|uniref:Zinc ABC transporter substrate-binding protein n=1 Tax=Babesia caballi TaxID=5871 RepID=A0AAV4M185_BABCB|nr:zinc ABC transporter substrate-binding protein [Babesia caballi]